MNAFLRGTGVALITPFDENGLIDYKAITLLVDHCVKGNIDYLVVLGTTAESVVLTKEEKKSLILHIVSINNNRLPLVLGVGGNDTMTIVKELSTVNTSEFSAILSVVPMYNKPTQEGIYQHYKMINDHSPLPILLYNVPSRTATNMEAETTLRLARLPNIIGIKEAVSDFTQVLKIINQRPDGFLVISGDDMLALPAIAAGGDGVISVVGQAVPEAFSQMVRLGLEGKIKQAYTVFYKLHPLIEYIFEEGNPAGIKHVLKLMKLCDDKVRLPLVSVSNALSQKIKKYINTIL